MIKPLGTIPYAPTLMARFKEGTLWPEWAEEYPFLFDELDQSQASNQAVTGHHFHEWLGAIQLYHSTGFHSLVAHYQFKNHTRKHEVLRRLWPARLQDFVIGRGIIDGPQCPDLVMYAPDYSDWFFCEVKGPNDRLRPKQKEFFLQLSEVAGRPVFELRLKVLVTTD